MQPHSQTQPGLAQDPHQLPGDAGLLQHIGGLLHPCPDPIGGLPVPGGLHEEEEDLQTVCPAQVVAQPRQLGEEVPHIVPVPDGHRREGPPLGQAGGGAQGPGPLGPGGLQTEHRVGGDLDGALHPHLGQLPGGSVVPEGDQGSTALRTRRRLAGSRTGPIPLA